MAFANQFKNQQAPSGFDLPKTAVSLLEAASSAGWRTGWQWSENSSGAPFVTVHIGNADTKELFQFTWHSQGSGTLRLFGKLHRKAGSAQWTDGPSVKTAIAQLSR